MKNSKLISLLETFDAGEQQSFRQFIASPYFNTRDELLPLYDCLQPLLDNLPEEALEKERVFSAAYPGENYDEKQLAYRMNYLLKLAERFLGVQRREAADALAQLDTLEALVNRRLDKHYYFIRREMDRELQGSAQVGADHFWLQHRLAEIGNKHFAFQEERRFDQHIQTAVDALDSFYYAKKLTLYCEMLSRQQLFQQSYRLDEQEQLLQVLEGSDLLKIPLLHIYYHILLMLTAADPDPHFQQVRELFDRHFDELATADREAILTHALNYCIRQIRIRTDKQFFMEESLRLYMVGIDRKIFLPQGHLSPWHFKNVVKLAFNLRKFDWAEHFMHTYAPFLQESFRENALYYNLADLFYQRHDYDQAMQYLLYVEFTDIHYQLSSKTLLLKIYYELDEEEALLSLLASFTISLKRNKLLSADVRKTYENFCRLLNKILRRNPRKMAAIKEEILSTSPITSREWLLKVLAEEESRL